MSASRVVDLDASAIQYVLGKTFVTDIISQGKIKFLLCRYRNLRIDIYFKSTYYCFISAYHTPTGCAKKENTRYGRKFIDL